MKTTKIVLKSLKQNQKKKKKNYYASMVNYDTKQTCQVMKEITDKQKTKSSSLPKAIRTK